MAFQDMLEKEPVILSVCRQPGRTAVPFAVQHWKWLLLAWRMQYLQLQLSSAVKQYQHIY